MAFGVEGLSKYVKLNWTNILVGGTATINNEHEYDSVFHRIFKVVVFMLS